MWPGGLRSFGRWDVVARSSANAVAERVIGSLRRECLDHGIPLDERHPRTSVTRYADDDDL